jgi:hypothetical protein
MDQLGDQLTTRPIETGWELTIEWYKSWRFGLLDIPNSQFGNIVVLSWTWTQSACPKLLLTLFLPADLVYLQIPRDDPVLTNNFEVLCRVVITSRPNCYQQLNSHCLLTNHYPVNTLLRIPPAD